jgi:hypothetical protein
MTAVSEMGKIYGECRNVRQYQSKDYSVKSGKLSAVDLASWAESSSVSHFSYVNIDLDLAATMDTIRSMRLGNDTFLEKFGAIQYSLGTAPSRRGSDSDSSSSDSSGAVAPKEREENSSQQFEIAKYLVEHGYELFFLKCTSAGGAFQVDPEFFNTPMLQAVNLTSTAAAAATTATTGTASAGRRLLSTTSSAALFGNILAVHQRFAHASVSSVLHRTSCRALRTALQHADRDRHTCEASNKGTQFTCLEKESHHSTHSKGSHHTAGHGDITAGSHKKSNTSSAGVGAQHIIKHKEHHHIQPAGSHVSDAA